MGMKQTLLKLHLIFGSFFLPMGIMFALTGGLYTWGIYGNYVTQNEVIGLDAPAVAELGSLVKTAEDFLQKHSLKPPTGTPSVKKMGTSWRLEWTGTHLDLLIEPTENPLELNASAKKTSVHRFFVQLHKAKGGIAFKILAGFFAFGLVGLFVSGLMLAQNHPRFKRLWWASTVLGILAFIIAATLS